MTFDLTGLSDNDHVKVVGDTTWHRVGDLRAASTAAPPDSYAPAVAAIRAAAAPVIVESFADRYRRERLAQLDAEHDRQRRWNAANPLPRNLAADGATYRAPNGYEIALAQRLAEEKRRGNN